MGEIHSKNSKIAYSESGPVNVRDVIVGSTIQYCNSMSDEKLEVQSCCEMQDTPCNKLKAKLQAHYKKIALPKVPWSKGGFGLEMENNFIQLQLHEHDYDKRIELKAIFHCNNDKNRILIEGQPGFGKTTLATKLAYDWAIGTEENRYINQFKFVFFLTLEQLQQPFDEAIANLVADCDFPVNADLVNIVNHHLKEVLLILDGLDQISLEKHKSILKILYEQKYSEATVIAFSRSGLFSLTNDELKQLFSHLSMQQTFHDKLITILGIPSLVDKQQFLRINRISEEKIQSVKNCMLSHMELFNSPLLLKLLSIILEKSEKFNELSLTQIELFKKLFCSNFGDFKLFHFESREANANQKCIQRFGKLAVEKIIEDDLKFDFKECEDHMYSFFKTYKRESSTETIKYCEASYWPIVEFAAAVAMWIDFELEKQFTKDKLQAIVRHFLKTKGTSQVMPFLASLMEENLLYLLKEMNLFGFWFSSRFHLSTKFLQECTLNNVNKNISYLENFIPSEVDIRDLAFSDLAFSGATDLYKNLLKCDKIQRITINSKTPLEVMADTTKPFKIICKIETNNMLSVLTDDKCKIKELFLHYPHKYMVNTSINLKEYFNFIATPTVKSCALVLKTLRDMSFLSIVLQEEKFECIKFHFLEVKIVREIHKETIEKLVKNHQVQFLKLSGEVNNELNMEKFSKLAADSTYLHSIHLSFFAINLQYLTNNGAKKYDYINIEHCKCTSSNLLPSNTFDYLSINPVNELIDQLEPTALNSYKMTIINLKRRNPKWTGFNSVKYLCLYEITKTDVLVQSIRPCKNLHTLHICMWQDSHEKQIVNCIKFLPTIKKIIIENPYRPATDLIKCMNENWTGKYCLTTIDIIYFYVNDDQLQSELDELKKGLKNKILSKVNLVAYKFEMEKIFTCEDLLVFDVVHYTYGSKNDDAKPYQMRYNKGVDREFHALTITEKT